MDETAGLSSCFMLVSVHYQETRSKELGDAFDSGVDGLTADTSSPSQVSSLLWFPGTSRAHSSGAIHQSATGSALRQNIYENFMRELETGLGQGGVGSGDRLDPSTGTEEGESSSESAEGSLEQLDLLFEKEQGVVRRAGWLSFKPLVTLHKDRRLELVTRRKWKQYWVTLKGEGKAGASLRPHRVPASLILLCARPCRMYAALLRDLQQRLPRAGALPPLRPPGRGQRRPGCS